MLSQDLSVIKLKINTISSLLLDSQFLMSSSKTPISPILSKVLFFSFTKIYKVYAKDDPSQAFAAKVALAQAQVIGDAYQETDLKKEAQILQDLKLQPGFPKWNSYHIESKYEIF